MDNNALVANLKLNSTEDFNLVSQRVHHYSKYFTINIFYIKQSEAVNYHSGTNISSISRVCNEIFKSYILHIKLEQLNGVRITK